MGRLEGDVNSLGLSAQAASIATTTYGVSVAVVGLLLVGSAVVVRWRRLRELYARLFSHSKKYSVTPIVNRCIAQLTEEGDARRRVMAILEKLCSMGHTADASLIIRNTVSGRWELQNCLGGRPMSCQMDLCEPFLEWLQRTPKMVSRRALVEDARCVGIKGPGLQYCVQFHANWIVPLMLGQKLIAVVNLGHPEEGRLVPPETATIIERLRPFMALCIHDAQLQEWMDAQQERLDNHQRLKSQLLSNLSHELRTPVHSIIGLADVLKDGELPEGATVSQYAVMIGDAGRRLMGTLSTMIDLAKLETNNITLDVRRVNLSKMLRKLAMEANPSGNVQMDVRLPEEMATVYGDSQWIEVAFKHLISNAVKFTSHGEIVVDANRSGEMLKIGIHDTGVGIPKERIGEIFQEFVQASDGVGRPYEGSGLGLAITRKIVELHGGRVAVESAPGKGSHFFITLPLKPTRVQARELRPCVNH
jgi:signal transduction histidine kinase